MIQINVFEEAMKIAEQRSSARVKRRLIDADQFEIDLWVFHAPRARVAKDGYIPVDAMSSFMC